jgi:hypothetical protein
LQFQGGTFKDLKAPQDVEDPSLPEKQFESALAKVKELEASLSSTQLEKVIPLATPSAVALNVGTTICGKPGRNACIYVVAEIFESLAGKQACVCRTLVDE